MTTRTTNYLAWTLQVILTFVIGGGGILKLIGDPAMIEMFDDVGIGQWFRYLVGLLELTAAIGLLIPRLRVTAAAGLVLLLVGATITNVAVLEVSPFSALVWAVLAAAVVYLRRDERLLRKGASRRSLDRTPGSSV